MQRESDDQVRKLYEGSAGWYDGIMDAEIELPIYGELLSGLAERLAELPGPLLDTSCGTGHMLMKYHEEYDAERQLIGVDLSTNMVELATKRLGSRASLHVGDMRDLSTIASASVAGVISFFALHHLRPEEISTTVQEWARVVKPGGILLLATWEGEGAIDYGEESDLIALRYRQAEVVNWAEKAGFEVDRSSTRAVDGMGMDAIYLEGIRRAG